MRFQFIACAMLFALPFLSGVGAQATVPGRNSVEYLNAQRTYHVGIDGQIVSLGKFNPRDEKAGALEVDSGPGYDRLLDCSNRAFLCNQIGRMFFAVPRSRLSMGQSYAVAGAQFRVMKCYRGTANTCSIGLVEANCETRAPSGGCEALPKGQNVGTNAGPVTYFFYSDRYGVTAFGFGDEKASNLDAAEAAAAMFSLQGDAGLLKK